jgi:hypothetical protein
LLCHACSSRLEDDLRLIPAVVEDLNVSLSKMSRIGAGGKAGKGGVHERWPVNAGAMQAADALAGKLVSWARDVDPGYWSSTEPNQTHAAALVLLANVDLIRRHEDVVGMVEEIHAAIAQARRAVDRPAERVFTGPCWATYPDEEGREITCLTDLYARVGADNVRCPTCYTEHPVAERRVWLLKQARDRLFTVSEASQMMGDVGGIKVTQDRIYGYLRRGRIVFHSSNLIRLGDLLDVVVGDGQKKRGISEFEEQALAG